MVLALVAMPLMAETQRVEGLEFERVLVHGSVKVEISQGDETELLMRGDQDQLEKQPFFVKGDTLVLGKSLKYKRDNFHNVKYKLTVVDLQHLQLNGSGEIYVKPLQTLDLYVSLEGSGDIKLFELRGRDITLQASGSGDIQAADLQAEELRAVLSGSGDIHIGELSVKNMTVTLNGSGDISVDGTGVAETLDANVVGSGDIDLKKLDAMEVQVNIVGSGTVSTGHVEKELDVNVMGSGDVYYSGDPEISQSTLGSGDLHRRD
jgi:hypothetical protein